MTEDQKTMALDLFYLATRLASEKITTSRIAGHLVDEANAAADIRSLMAVMLGVKSVKFEPIVSLPWDGELDSESAEKTMVSVKVIIEPKEGY